MGEKFGALWQFSGSNFAEKFQLFVWIKTGQGSTGFIKQEGEGVKEWAVLLIRQMIGGGNQKAADRHFQARLFVHLAQKSSQHRLTRMNPAGQQAIAIDRVKGLFRGEQTTARTPHNHADFTIAVAATERIKHLCDLKPGEMYQRLTKLLG